ncbi:YncE family protein, partial [Rhodococcus cerastii]|nr:YncE family protein [Rhodococcus cerastii]
MTRAGSGSTGPRRRPRLRGAAASMAVLGTITGLLLAGGALPAAADTVVATVGVGALPYWVAIAPDGAHAYTANAGNASVSVIDTATNTVTATVGVGTGPYGVAVAPDGARAYTANAGNASVSVIDTAT